MLSFTIWDHQKPEKEIVIEDLEEGQRAYLIASVPASAENIILKELGFITHTAKEWKKAIKEKGYKITHSELEHELIAFDGFADLERWLLSTWMPNEVDQFVAILKEKGWVDLGDGKIRLPIQRLVVVVENCGDE